MKKFKTLALLSLLLLCVMLVACKGGDKTAVVAFPQDSSGGYTWDAPQFNAEYFTLTSQRTYSEEAPGLPTTQYREWTFTPLKAGTCDIVFTQYASQQDLEAQQNPFRKVTITYEISDNLTVKEADRVDLHYDE